MVILCRLDPRQLCRPRLCLLRDRVGRGPKTSPPKPQALIPSRGRPNLAATGLIHGLLFSPPSELSVAAEETHKRLYWIPYCELQDTSPLRPDMRSLDHDESQLESPAQRWRKCGPRPRQEVLHW